MTATRDALQAGRSAGGATRRSAACSGRARRAGGLSTAVVAGLHMARGDLVLRHGCGPPTPPELIPEMLAAADAGADLVVAAGTSRGNAGGLARAGRHWSAAAPAWSLRSSSGSPPEHRPAFGYFSAGAASSTASSSAGRFQDPPRTAGLRTGTAVVTALRSRLGRRDQQGSARQGVLFLHTWLALLPGRRLGADLEVRPGRVSGLVLFLPPLGPAGPGHLPPLLAFLPPSPELRLEPVWNGHGPRGPAPAATGRRRPRLPPPSVPRHLLVTYPAFALLCLTSLPVIASGALAAGAGWSPTAWPTAEHPPRTDDLGQVAVDTAVRLGSTDWPGRSRPTAPSPPPGAAVTSSTVPPSC